MLGSAALIAPASGFVTPSYHGAHGAPGAPALRACSGAAGAAADAQGSAFGTSAATI
eukprot:CAMPEP_0203868466 /NCGR_PEP_ID=MMETSP0359-20131031/17122_1 /ASSEMBLY_ACC=CAM_ASM_000338 /TAXON_ID=268821 /ORGANISM="Scrippsiella Hangoei, Strain SHTV-5" /LENGTH=56 /DNA_ID=CAMNT_0050786877 /DNA_START=75 /DNA_END=242 /DNA_ORIENTATION=+